MQYFGLVHVLIFSAFTVGLFCSTNDLKRLKARVKLLETRLNFQATIRDEEYAEITERLDGIDNILNVTVETSTSVTSETSASLDKDIIDLLKENYARIRKAFREEKIVTERIRREIPKIGTSLVSVQENVEIFCKNSLNKTGMLLDGFKESSELDKKSMRGLTEQINAVQSNTERIWWEFPMLKDSLISINDNVEMNCKGAFNNTESNVKTQIEDRLVLQDITEKVKLLTRKVQLNTENNKEMSKQVRNLETIVNNHFLRMESLLLNVSSYSTHRHTFKPITDEEGWIAFQRRWNGKVDFYRDWDEYKKGFGDLNGEFWLGNDHLSELTADGNRELKIEMEDFEGNRAFAKYSTFKVYPEEYRYKLEVSGYTGTAGDSLEWHNGSKFSTFDNNNDVKALNCAVYRHGAWWYRSCYMSNNITMSHVKETKLELSGGIGRKSTTV